MRNGKCCPSFSDRPELQRTVARTAEQYTREQRGVTWTGTHLSNNTRMVHFPLPLFVARRVFCLRNLIKLKLTLVKSEGCSRMKFAPHSLVQTSNEISWRLFKSLSLNPRRWEPERLATKLGHNELVYVRRRLNTTDRQNKVRTEIEV